VKSYTGCLSSGDGSIVKVKEGDAPKSACSSSQTLVHLSGGDITKVSVTGGLTGGGENGEVTIGLDPKFSLPQNCTAPTNVAKFNGTAWVCASDDDTTYSSGTGLDLTGTVFSIEPAYRVKNDSDCSSGQFATGFASSGAIECAAPAATSLTAVSDTQTDPDGEGIPDDDTYHTFASVSPAAGTYLVIAEGVVFSEGNVDQFRGVNCSIRNAGTTVDTMRLVDNNLDDEGMFPFALSAITTLSSGALELACSANDGADGLQLEHAAINALKVG
jgi:hypothetical protein